MGVTEPASAAEEQLLTDFTPETAALGWYVLNDKVMGGRSDGNFAFRDGLLSFRGRTNTNGGGFSSIRTGALSLDLSQHQGIRIRVKGDGRRYTWRLSTDARYRGREIGYWAEFETVAGEWQTVDIPFESFIPRFRGQRLQGPALNVHRIGGMGLMIYDGQDGPFALELARVSAYGAREPFSLAELRWKKRILVVSSPDETNEDYRTQRADILRTAAQSRERDLVLITLVGDEESRMDGRPLTDEEVREVRNALGLLRKSFALRLIGKDGGTKLARDGATPMAEIHALIDSMPMRQQEMRER